MLLHQVKRIAYLRFKTSFAKSGEDIQLVQLLNKTKRGFFVDVGAHHPIKGSNSYFFYLRGWKGLCIDPNLALRAEWEKYRPKDTLAQVGIGSKREKRKYYRLTDKYQTMNSFSLEYIRSMGLENEIISEEIIDIFPLKEIITHYLHPDIPFSFLSIDCEGLDYDALCGNDWSSYRPVIVLVESQKSLMVDVSSEIVQFMLEQEYELIGKTVLRHPFGSLFFQNARNE